MFLVNIARSLYSSNINLVSKILTDSLKSQHKSLGPGIYNYMFSLKTKMFLSFSHLFLQTWNAMKSRKSGFMLQGGIEQDG